MSLPLPTCSSPQYCLVNSISGIDNGVRFQDQLRQIVHHPNNQEAYSSTSCGANRLTECYESLATELEKQRQEIDWLLQLENHRLTTIVHEKTRQQAVILERYESRLMNLMRLKDKDIEIARKRSLELQNLMVKAEFEALGWQRKAVDNEAMVLDLNNRLDQVRERNLCVPNCAAAQDAESFCDSPCKMMVACKLCNTRSPCVVFLPCRHLCSCEACESLLALCPVCETVKEASIEVFLV